MLRYAVVVFALLALALFSIGSIHPAGAASVPPRVMPASFQRAIHPGPFPASPSVANYDEQIGETFAQNFAGLAYNVTAVAQQDGDGVGPAYLLNGLTDAGYWYQVGVSYNWPYLSGGHVSGFQMNYEVFNSSGTSIFPSMGGGLVAFTGSVNGGDIVLLSLYFSNGNVVMSVHDWSTGAQASATYSAQGVQFIGLQSASNSHGFFTGLMTEWYHTSAYYSGEGPVKYSNPSFALSSAVLWAEEYIAPCCPTPLFFASHSVTFQDPLVIQTFSSNGALAFANAYTLLTGLLNSGLLTLSYTVSGGGSGYSAPTLTYTQSGVQQGTTLTGSPITYFPDTGSSWSVSRILPGSSSNEQWEVLQANGSVNSSTTMNLVYYHQVLVTFQYTLANAGTGSPPSASPAIQYQQFVGLVTTATNSPVWVDVGSSYAYDISLAGATSTERWGTPTQSNIIGTPGAITTTYYHQFALALSYAVIGGGTPVVPALSGTQFGTSANTQLQSQFGLIWLDSGSAWSVANRLNGSTSQERWESNSSISGTIDRASTASITFYHQYAVTLSYEIKGGGNPTTPLLSGKQFGQTYPATLAGTPAAYFLDSGSNWAVPGLLAGSSSDERWVGAEPGSGLVSAASAIGIKYHHQFHVSTIFGPSSGGSITNSTGWHDSGTSLVMSATANQGWKFEGWTGSGSGAYSGPLNSTSIQINGPVVENATFYPGLGVTSPANGAVGYSYGSQSGTIPAGSSTTIFAPAGTVISLNAIPSSLLYQFAGWTPSTLGTSGRTTLKLEAPQTGQASFSLNLVTIGGVGAIAAVAVVSIFALRLTSKSRSSGTDSPPF